MKLLCSDICNLFLTILLAKLSFLSSCKDMILIPFSNILYTFPIWLEGEIQLFRCIWNSNMFQMSFPKHNGPTVCFLAQQFYSIIVKRWLQFHIITLGTDSGSYPDLFCFTFRNYVNIICLFSRFPPPLLHADLIFHRPHNISALTFVSLCLAHATSAWKPFVKLATHSPGLLYLWTVNHT